MASVERGDSWNARGLLVAVALLSSIFAGGTVGYAIIEGWAPWDAFYMTVISVTTVGYREVHELPRAGQIFTVCLALGGVGVAFYTLTQLMALVVEGGAAGLFQRRRRAHMIDTIRDHFIVCGFGRIGSIVALRQRFGIIESEAGS